MADMIPCRTCGHYHILCDDEKEELRNEIGRLSAEETANLRLISSVSNENAELRSKLATCEARAYERAAKVCCTRCANGEAAIFHAGYWRHMQAPTKLNATSDIMICEGWIQCNAGHIRALDKLAADHAAVVAHLGEKMREEPMPRVIVNPVIRVLVTKTPRTDAIVAIASIEDRYIPLRDLARQLERELATCEASAYEKAAKVAHEWATKHLVHKEHDYPYNPVDGYYNPAQAAEQIEIAIRALSPAPVVTSGTGGEK